MNFWESALIVQSIQLNRGNNSYINTHPFYRKLKEKEYCFAHSS
ncbi:MAG: class II glutamine amidotransferase [Spirochaetes bacterium]|nr:class II glutamine amidotransferase [Spirochaetota bacterium]MBP8991546.1 class II glutamine amidotransferase [Spirochaetota bacterium]NLJ04767.1 hypothetical protein [Exilispira sp.]